MGNSPDRGVDNLAHQRGAILEELVEDLCFYCEATGAGPFRVLGLELTEELRGLVRRGDGVEVGCIGVDGRRSAVRM